MPTSAPGPPGEWHIHPQGAQKTPENAPSLMESSEFSVQVLHQYQSENLAHSSCCCGVKASQGDPAEQSGHSVVQPCSCSGHVGLEIQHGPRGGESSPATPGEQSHRHCRSQGSSIGQPMQTPRAGQTATFPPHTPTAVHHCRHIPCASGLCAWLHVTDVTTTSKSWEVQLGAGAGICSAGILHSLLVPWSPWEWGVFALI